MVRKVLAVCVGVLLSLVPVDVGAAAPPSALTAFTPVDLLPGAWRSGRSPSPLRLTGPAGGVCDGSTATWVRDGDGLQLGLGWFTCGVDDLTELARGLALERLTAPRPLQDRSVLGVTDLVAELPDGTAVRTWQQASYVVQLNLSPCDDIEAACHDLTARAATALSSALPGTPVATSVLPRFSGVVSAFLLYWLLFIGVPVLGAYLLRPRFRRGPPDSRLTAVDGAAYALRWRSRGRRAGQVLLILGGLVTTIWLVPLVGGGTAPTAAAIIFTVFAGLGGLALVMLCWHPQLRAAWLTAKLRLDPARLASALLTGVLGLLAVSIPVTAFVFLVVFSLVDQSGDVPRLFAGVFFAGAAVGFGIDQLARRLRARTADEAIDDRVEEPPILYLRNFGDDRQKIPVSALSRRGLFALVVTAVSPIRRTRFEELLARTLGRWGPVVALSDPNVSLPTLGAAKIEPLGDDWRDVVRARANAAHAVVVSATPGQVGPGLRWELDLLAHAVPHGRIVLVLGPGPDRATPAQCFSTFLAATERFALFAPLIGWIPDATLVLVHVPREGIGSWYGWTARRRTGWTYAAAVDAALAFAEKSWTDDRPDRPARVFDQPLSEVVQASLDEATAAARTTTEPAVARAVDTRDILFALMHTDATGDWSRIWLHGRTPEAVAAAEVHDPAGDAHAYWRGAALTVTADAALITAMRSARANGLLPLPAGMLAMGLINDSSTAAAQALGASGPTERAQLLTVMQEDLLGVNVSSLHPAQTSGPSAQLAPTSALAAPTPSSSPAHSTPEAARLRLRTVVIAVFVVACAGGATQRIPTRDGPDDLIGATIWGLILGPVLLWTVATGNGNRRYARWVALVGFLIIAGLDATALARAGLFS